jgi:NADH-quinone oxidoreductase subunit H
MIEKILTIVPLWLIILLVIFQTMLGAAAYLILLERKIASWVQDRIGPNRVGPWGLLQPLADGLKMFTKEDYRPPGTDKYIFSVAPMLMMLVVFTAVAIIPWGGVYQGSIDPSATLPIGATKVDALSTATSTVYRIPIQIADVNIGVLFAVAILALAVYSVVFAGWASNNKYSFLGGMRAAAQMISYEVPLGLAIITIVLMHGTLSLNDIVSAQAGYWCGFVPSWNIFTQPMAFLIFLTCLHAEANRAPIDLAEAEQELVGGYHTEYTSMRLGLLLMGEYIEMTVTSAILVALFLGGWHLPGLTGNVDPANASVTSSVLEILLRVGVYFAKIGVIIAVFMWVRWSLPRFRYDQLMNLSWRALVPISLSIMFATAVVVFYFRGPVTAGIIRIGTREALALFVANLVLLVLFAIGSRLMPTRDVNRRMPVPHTRFSTEPTL